MNKDFTALYNSKALYSTKKFTAFYNSNVLLGYLGYCYGLNVCVPPKCLC